MANIFVRGATGLNANTGADWNNAKQTVAGALAIAASNDIILVDNLESFTATALITWTPPAGNVAIISVARSGTTGFTKATGATESVGATTVAFTIAGAASSSMYVWGMTLNSGSSNAAGCNFNLLNTAGVSSVLLLENCSLGLPTINNACFVLCGATAQAVSRSMSVTLKNTTITYGSRTGSAFNLGDVFLELIAVSLVYGASKPAQVFTVGSAADQPIVTVRDCNWSGIVSTPLVLGTNNAAATFLFKNCKLPSGSWFGGAWTFGAGTVTFRNCFSTSYTALYEHYSFFGTHFATAGQYITSGDGAVFAGAGACWGVNTNPGANEFAPFVTQTLEVWNDTVGTRTATVEIASTAAGPYTDRQIWMEASYDHNNAGAVISNRNAEPFTGTGANHPTSTASWQISTVSKQQMQLTFTATQIGLLQIRIYIAITSLSNFFINPVINLT